MNCMRFVAAFIAMAGAFTKVFASPGSATEILVLGVIAAEDETKGVALLKDMSSKKTFAVRAGHELAPQISVRGVTRDFVYIRVGEKTEKLRVGEQLDPSSTAASPTEDLSSNLGVNSGGIERKGDSVRVTNAFKEHVVGRNLGKVLMQAAAVPHYESGQLKGFTLWEIDKGSVYELAGFQDGDTITAINGQDLTDVGNTIKLLHSLKGESRAEVRVKRSGTERTIKIEVQ